MASAVAATEAKEPNEVDEDLRGMMGTMMSKEDKVKDDEEDGRISPTAAMSKAAQRLDLAPPPDADVSTLPILLRRGGSAAQPQVVPPSAPRHRICAP